MLKNGKILCDWNTLFQSKNSVNVLQGQIYILKQVEKIITAVASMLHELKAVTNQPPTTLKDVETWIHSYNIYLQWNEAEHFLTWRWENLPKIKEVICQANRALNWTILWPQNFGLGDLHLSLTRTSVPDKFYAGWGRVTMLLQFLFLTPSRTSAELYVSIDDDDDTVTLTCTSVTTIAWTSTIIGWHRFSRIVIHVNINVKTKYLLNAKS